MLPRLLPFLLAGALAATATAREFTVLSYNVENLFDADKVATFDDYVENSTPDGYSPAKALNKIKGVAAVLKTFNDGQGPEVIGFNEFEMDFTPDSKVPDLAAFLEQYRNTTVDRMLTTELNDEIRGLPVEALLLKYLEDSGLKGYHVAVGQDQPDLSLVDNNDRGVRKKAHKNAVFSKFPITATKTHETPDARAILEATLDVEGHPVTLFVNHWKSGASDFGSEQVRRMNAKTLRDRVDAILAADPSADIIMVGDFNSQYNQTAMYPYMGQTAVNDVLGSQGDEAKTAAARELSIYNLWHELPVAERGSDHFDGAWGTLMQIMIVPGLYDHNGVQYVDNSFNVARRPGINTFTPFNIPRRWTNRGGGYGTSDHFPVYARFRTVPDGDKEKRLALTSPSNSPDPTTAVRVGFEKAASMKLPEFTGPAAADPEKHIGEIFRVQGTVAKLRPLTIEVGGREFSWWARNPELRKQLQSFRKGDRVPFIGELGAFKGQLQFTVNDPAWLLRQPPGRD